jgi:Asp-tRNA(Asn)/Glu-tRNA(Gln) amidotransferase A subunit family amidase
VSELHWLTAVEAARAIVARELSPVELMTALLERIGWLDPKLNVFIRLDGEAAMEAARGPRPRSPRAAFAGRCMACRSGSRTSSMSLVCRRPAIPES